ncbi:MAG: RNA polymerase sigma-70 factor [Bacteroidia bacterium]|nr:RNA polymerase sigma-70 factor [Bacteroidia bacterium]
MINKEIHIDRNMLLRLKSGNQDAFEFIFNKYYNSIYTFVLNTLYDKLFAEDIAQSVFVILWEQRHTINEEKNIANFLYTIAKNSVYRQTERLLLKLKYEEHEKESPITRIDIEEDVNSRFLEDILSELIEKLPPARKEIFILSRKKHFTNREIAQQLSISEKTVETQLRRSLIFLKEKMQYYLTLFLL